MSFIKPTVASAVTGNDGFFSTLGGALTGITKTAGTVGQNLVPIWAAKEFNLQSSDQLRAPTFDSRFASPRVEEFGPDGRPLKTGFLFDNVNISTAGLLIGSVAVLAIIFALKR